jgi:hypothetical protein
MMVLPKLGQDLVMALVECVVVSEGHVVEHLPPIALVALRIDETRAS